MSDDCGGKKTLDAPVHAIIPRYISVGYSRLAYIRVYLGNFGFWRIIISILYYSEYNDHVSSINTSISSIKYMGNHLWDKILREHIVCRTVINYLYRTETVSLQSEGCDSVQYTTMRFFILRCVHSRRKENSFNGFFLFRWKKNKYVFTRFNPAYRVYICTYAICRRFSRARAITQK